MRDAKKIIEEFSNPKSKSYLDLPALLRRFSYPVSLAVSEWIGSKVYQKGFADGLEFLTLMANKFYTRIIGNPSGNLLESFIANENKLIEHKTRELVLAAKRWESSSITNTELSGAINDFCIKTHGVRLPMESFFLRMILPEKFGTLDVRCISALKQLGFKVKNIPVGEKDKEAYLEQFDGMEYLKYNDLLTEIGKHYSVPSALGGDRCMTPSEVDMALYQFDKEGGKADYPPQDSANTSQKIQGIMQVVQEIVKGTERGPSWVQRAGMKFLHTMEQYARAGDLESMFRYYSNLARGSTGKGVGGWLATHGLPSIESELGKVRNIYSGET